MDLQRVKDIIFTEVRPWLDSKGFTDSRIAALNNAIELAMSVQEERKAVALKNPPSFYAMVRSGFGTLEQSQVDGFEFVLAAMGAAGWPVTWAAYALATSWHETNKTMKPVREAYWLSEDWRRTHLRYYPWYGRGYVQLTWEDNYKWADRELGLGGKLLSDPDQAMVPENAAKILVKGMEQGAFSRDKQGPRSLPRYLNRGQSATHEEYRLCRPIINIMDKASEIADHAVKFEAALKAGGWA